MQVAVIDKDFVEQLQATLEENMALIQSLKQKNIEAAAKWPIPVREVARILDCQPSTILSKKDEFDIVQTGKGYVITVESVEAYIKRRTLKARK